MKPKNFPARKLARQQAARLRLQTGSSAYTAQNALLLASGRGSGLLNQARAIRTKKNRSGR